MSRGDTEQEKIINRIANYQIHMDIREQYFNGEIFTMGQIVESTYGIGEIIFCGSNYVTVAYQDGTISKQWLDTITVAEEQLQIFASGSILGYTSESISVDELVLLAECDKQAAHQFVLAIDEQNTQKIETWGSRLCSHQKIKSLVEKYMPKPESPIVDTTKPDNLASGIMNTKDFRKAKKLMSCADVPVVSEDSYASDYIIKKFVTPDGHTHSRKIRPNRIGFMASKENGQIDALNIKLGARSIDGTKITKSMKRRAHRDADRDDPVSESLVEDYMPSDVQHKKTLHKAYGELSHTFNKKHDSSVEQHLGSMGFKKNGPSDHSPRSETTHYKHENGTTAMHIKRKGSNSELHVQSNSLKEELQLMSFSEFLKQKEEV